MKKGFSLAELMVALVVLGILAAILIPAMTSTAPDSDRVMFKKAYNTLENAVAELINDDVNYPGTVLGNDVNGTSVMRGFNYTDIATSPSIPADQTKFCYLLSEKLNTIGQVDCRTDAIRSFTTSDGIIWRVFSQDNLNPFPLRPEAAAVGTYVTVDVNGTKEPNCGRDMTAEKAENPPINDCAADVQPDTFAIGIRYDGKLFVDDAGALLLVDPTNNVRQ